MNQSPANNQEQQASNEGRPAMIARARYRLQAGILAAYPQVPDVLNELARQQMEVSRQPSLMQASSKAIAATVNEIPVMNPVDSATNELLAQAHRLVEDAHND